MDIRYLQSFVTVVEVGSLAEAARRLDLTPAAIAARVRGLEEELGAVLVKRAGRSVKPTAAGEKILERARAVLRDIRDLRATASDSESLGELRLGVFVSAMTSVLPPVLKRLYERFPDLNVLVVTGSSVELCHQVATGAIDAAFVVEPQFAVAKSCAWTSLMEEPLVVVAHHSMTYRALYSIRPFCAGGAVGRPLLARPKYSSQAAAGDRWPDGHCFLGRSGSRSGTATRLGAVVAIGPFHHPYQLT